MHVLWWGGGGEREIVFEYSKSLRVDLQKQRVTIRLFCCLFVCLLVFCGGREGVFGPCFVMQY